MHSKVDELLCSTLWFMEHCVHPTFFTLNESYEAWLRRHGFSEQINYAQKQGFLERKTSGNQPQRRLTQRGRLHALGGRDPVAEWERKWDGKWRWVVFDLPEKQSSARRNLRRRWRSDKLSHLCSDKLSHPSCTQRWEIPFQVVAGVARA